MLKAALLLATVLAAPALATPAASAALPFSSAATPAELSTFFSQGVDTLDAFCRPAATCTPRQQKQALFRLYFRGGFARPLPAAPADPEAAYARQAVAYFSEPDYVCRRPLTARVLERLWELPPRVADCPETVPFLLTGKDGKPTLRHVAPGRIAAVHLLFAGADGRGVSSFGHVGLRLLLCTPQRAQVDTACEEDLFDHLALGFRAAVDELDISTWKGLTGGYALRFYADPFMQLYEQYTTQEFRPLYSLPLALTPEAQTLLVQALAEVHWSYQHDYRFFTQNCASELSWLLHVVNAVSGMPRWLDTSNVRPDRLFAQARQSPAFGGERLLDLVQAEKDGFYFPGSAPYYQRALDTLRQRIDGADLTRWPPDFAAFRRLDAAQRRRDIYAPALTGAGSAAAGRPTIARAAHAALVLEAWREQRTRRELLAGMARHYQALLDVLLARTAYFTPAEQVVLQRCLAGLGQSNQLGHQADGVPAAPTLAESGCGLGTPELQALVEKLFAIAPPMQQLSQGFAELQATVDTVNWLLPQTGLATTSTSKQGNSDE